MATIFLNQKITLKTDLSLAANIPTSQSVNIKQDFDKYIFLLATFQCLDS